LTLDKFGFCFIVKHDRSLFDCAFHHGLGWFIAWRFVSNKRSLDFFELLLTISGIGPKSALGILSATTVDSIIEAITTGESAYLTKIAGIGKKVVEKIILELKGKIGENFGSSPDSPKTNNADVDALEALKSLGYTHKEAKDALDEVSGDIKGTGEKVKAALKNLSK
jgi:Holliday junction DNA helicase RuvA